MGGDFVSRSGGIASPPHALVVPALRKNAKDGPPAFVGDVSEIKKLGHWPS